MSSKQPPIAAVIPHESTIHGHTRVDNYHWLRQRDNPDVIAYLNAENEYTASVMKPTEALQERLFEEIKSRIKETDVSVPAKDGPEYYYTRTVEGKQYPIHCRKRGSLDADEEILLDVNALAEDKQYLRIGGLRVSPSRALLAYSVDDSGAETYTLKFKNLEDGSMLHDEIPGTYYGLAWSADSGSVFYTTLDDAKRPYRVHRHILGTDAAADAVVYEETDERFHVRLSKTRSRKFIVIQSDSQITSEARVIDADHPESPPRLIAGRRQGIEYNVSHRGDYFYILTNDGAVNFKLVRAPIDRPDHHTWIDVIPPRDDVRIESVDMFRNFFVVFERDRGLRRLRVIDLEKFTDHYVEFPEPTYTVFSGDNREFETDKYRYQYTSLVTPRSVFDYDIATRRAELLKREEVLGGYDPDAYLSQRVFATAEDGTAVPMSIVYRKGLERDGKDPCLLYGYGSYGYSMNPRFSSARISLLDRGFVYAIAHIRGGSEMGRPWYEDGKLLKKRNTFTDFIACAEQLIADGYTSPDRLAIEGGSAGGLLMGAVTNMRPDLFKAVIANVPFVDVVNTMLDDSIPLTTIEYEEWGNPNDPEYYEYMLSYSPYDNVEPKDYPNMLVTAGLNDPRVQYWEPAKWVAKLRALKTDHNRLLLKTNMGAGHGGRSGRYEHLREIAFEYAFLLDVLGRADRP